MQNAAPQYGADQCIRPGGSYFHQQLAVVQQKLLPGAGRLHELDGELAVTPEALNAVLPEGVRVLEVYESTRKARELRRLRALLTLEYDGAVPEPAAITTLLERPELVVEKRTKRGMAETDIRPMLHAYHVEAAPGALLLTCEVSAQEPSLNPMLLAAAIERYLPEAKPDFVRCRRLEMLDEQGEVFR